MSPAARRAALEEKWLRESEHCCHAGAADRFERPGNISVVYREVRVEIVCGPGGCDDRDRFELV